MSVTPSVAPPEDFGLNIAVAIGEIASEPIIRELPSGGTAMSFSLRVREGDHPTTSVPVLVYDPTKLVAALTRDQRVVVVGRVSRRFFTAGGATQSRTELLAHKIQSVRRRANCRRSLGCVSDLLQATVLESFV